MMKTKEKNRNDINFQRPWIFYLFSILLIGLAIRIPLMFASMDGDEGTNYTYYGALPWSELFSTYTSTNQHSLYVAIAYIFRLIFGESEFVFRLPSLLTGILSGYLVYTLSYRITRSPFVSTIAAALIIFSIQNLEYSVRGRGYTLSLFLSLLSTHAILNTFEKKAPIFWGTMFSIFGLGLVVTLPSNAVFLGEITIFFWVLKWSKTNIKDLIFSKSFYRENWFIFLTVFLTLSYFGVILEDLKFGILIYKEYAISVGKHIYWSFERAIKVFSELFQPWGISIFLVFVFGIYSLRKSPYFLPILGFYIFFILFQGGQNILPPARALIQLLPFFFIISAIGCHEILEKSFKRLPIGFHKFPIILLVAFISIPAAIKSPQFYKKRARYIGAAKIGDSIKALEYLKEKIPNKSLIVLPTIDRALNHYLVKEVTRRNVEAIKNRKIENIFFIGKKPFKFLSFGAPQKDLKYVEFPKSDLPNKLFPEIKEIGDLGIFKYSGKILKITPDQADVENLIFPAKKENSVFKINPNNIDRVEGQNSIEIINKTNFTFLQNAIKKSEVNLLEYEWRLALIVHFYKYNQDGGFILYDKFHTTNPFFFYLNQQQGGFTLSEGKLKYFESFPFEYLHKRSWNIPFPYPKDSWRVDLKLFPLEDVRELTGLSFYFAPNKNIYDGIGIFLLVP